MQVQGAAYSASSSVMQSAGDGGHVSSQGAQISAAQVVSQATASAQGANRGSAGMVTDLRALPGEHPAARSQVQRDTPERGLQGQNSCTYSQSTGNLTCTDSEGRQVINHNGYSGRNVSGGVQGRNNPDAQHVENTGPIPRGHYTIGPARNSERTGPAVRDLTPDPANNMEGRAHFEIHGDNRANDASEGCIIMPREVRDRLNSGDSLEVVQ